MDRSFAFSMVFTNASAIVLSFRLWLYPPQRTVYQAVLFPVFAAGAAIFVLELVRVQWIGVRQERLITTGFFRYTRHPMAHALVLIEPWLIAPYYAEPFFWMLSLASYAFLVVALWAQEKEVLETWGDEARDYYARTPRLIIFYPWKRHLRGSRARL